MQAESLRAQARNAEALTVVREGLTLLCSRGTRGGAPESTLLLSLTILGEELASELDCEGVDERCLVGSIQTLECWEEAVSRFPDLSAGESQAVRDFRSERLPYLRERLATRRRTSGCS